MADPTSPSPDPKKRLADLRAKLREAERLAGPAAGYVRHKERTAERQREQSARGREIGPLPAVVDPARKERCRTDLHQFAETYFPHRLYWPFSPSHLDDLKTLQRCAVDGGCFAYARPRGEGKTVLSEITALWATGYGYRRYALIVAANDKPLAADILDSIQKEIEGNDLLAEDFPEIAFPVRCLGGIHQKTHGQTLNGERTMIEFRRDGVRFPRVRGAVCSGSIIECVGITAAIRGRKAQAPDGTPLRPDFVVLDDPQSRESAKSPTQTADRLAIIRGDILGLAGPDTPLAVVMPCTVLYPRDLADQLLDREKSPQWQGRRTKRLLKWPTNMALWDEYARVRADGLRNDDGGRAGNEFYIEHRAALDDGAEVSWPERIKRGEVSAIQGAMNRWIDNPHEFFAEDQNSPQVDALVQGAKKLAPDQVVERLSGLDRFVVPRETIKLTAMFDPGIYLLWYMVVAWSERGGGSVIDYGCWPRQNRTWFEARDARPSLRDALPGFTEPQLVFASLKALVPEVMDRTYKGEAGGDYKIDRALIDCGKLPDAVYQFVRQQGGPIYPSKGIGRTLTSRGVSEWPRRTGEQVGYHWRLTVPHEGRVRMCQFDPDAWKSRVYELLTTPLGGARALTLWGKAKTDQERQQAFAQHEMIANHLAAEYSEPKELRGSWFDKWLEYPHRPDNHLLDCLTAAAVAAGVSGVEWSATPTGQPEPKPDVKPVRRFSEIQAEKMKKRAAVGGGPWRPG